MNKDEYDALTGAADKGDSITIEQLLEGLTFIKDNHEDFRGMSTVSWCEEAAMLIQACNGLSDSLDYAYAIADDQAPSSRHDTGYWMDSLIESIKDEAAHGRQS